MTGEIKRLKLGSNHKDDLEFLRSLKASDFSGDGVLAGVSNSDLVELLIKWNNLQKTPNKRRNFTFMEIGKASKISNYLIHTYPSSGFPKYAFIKHNKDNSEHIHFHFYIEYQNPRSFASVANELQIPVTNLQQVFNKTGILEYLTHENDPDKYHYDKSDIVSNFNIQDEIEERQINPLEEYNDYWAMRRGLMSKKEFFDKYKIDIVRHSSFASRVAMYSKMETDS